MKNTLSGVGLLSSRAILDNTGAKNQFINILNDHNGIAPFSALMDPSLAKRHFYNAFKEAYNIQFSSTNLCPDGFDPQPYPSDPGLLEIDFDTYLHNILNEHCLEIIQPYAFTFDVNRMSFVAHPLTESNTNGGYIIYQNGVCILPTTITDSNGFGTTQTPSNHLNLIVVRPSTTDDYGVYCGYPMYNSIDWNTFFGN